MQDGELWELGMSARPINETECGSWLTPTVQDSNKATKRWREDRQNNLTAQVFNQKMWPTPATRDYKGGHSPSALIRQDGKSRMDILPNVVAYGGLTTQQKQEMNQVSSERAQQLNPSWVAWLMGFPIGWESLKPLATLKFRNVQQWHSIFYPKD
jgi:DNA (cytosine-5)-methyltransferase 1